MLLRFLLLGALTCSVCAVIAANDDRIKHIVVLQMENRPFDHLFGWAGDLLGVDGLTGKEYNLVNPNEPDGEKVYVDNKAPFLNQCDPNHSVSATAKKMFSTSASIASGVPDMGGFVAFENKSVTHNYCNVMQGFPPSKVPVLTALAQEYAIMDRLFASLPGPTWPNRMFTLSGTSAGSLGTNVWYDNIPGKLYPQKVFYDQIEEAGLTWKHYFNDTPWEIYMEKMAHSPHNMHPLDQFYRDAEAGALPSFAWLNPRSGINVTTGVGSNDQHPDHDIRAGEQYYKDIYEALRASPAWYATLFIVTYDEHGGFYDHVPPPTKGVPPPNDGKKSYPGSYNFDSLGMRVPTILISPWIKKGTVVNRPIPSGMPTNTSEYDLTSIIATARKLLSGMGNIGPLTDRDAWSATFEHVLMDLDNPRQDCVMHLPDALPPQLPTSAEALAEAALPLNDLQADIAAIHAYMGDGEEVPATQGEHSVFLMRQYEKHRSRTLDWLSSKTATDAKVVVKPLSYYLSTGGAQWALNGLRHGDMSGKYANSTAPYIVLSALVMKRSDGTSYCLDGGDGKAGSLLKATACYPSENPDANRDAMQHFVLHNDGTLRLYSSSGQDHLCVTNHLFDKTTRRALGEFTADQERVTLEECDDSMNQTYAYHGVAPGDGGGGYLEFGDVDYYLGIATA